MASRPAPAQSAFRPRAQAVPQGRSGATYRDNHQQHPRLLYRQEFAQLARPAADRFSGQPPFAPGRTISHDCLLAEETFQKVNRPIQVHSQRASALRFADPQVQALWSALLLFQLLPTGFSNHQLPQRLAPLLGQEPAELTQGRMTYHLRRLRLHGMIERIPKSHRYRLTRSRSAYRLVLHTHLRSHSLPRTRKNIPRTSRLHWVTPP